MTAPARLGPIRRPHPKPFPISRTIIGKTWKGSDYLWPKRSLTFFNFFSIRLK